MYDDYVGVSTSPQVADLTIYGVDPPLANSRPFIAAASVFPCSHLRHSTKGREHEIVSLSPLET